MPPEVETHLVNAVLTNGARYYVDHAHPELSTPECADPRSIVVYDRAAELILHRSMAAATALLPEGQEIVVYKNNSDRKGNSYGCHENYLMDRAVPFSKIVAPRDAALHHPADLHRAPARSAPRRPGSRSAEVPFQLTQRADFFEEEVGLETTLKRPIVNTRDEPHADAQKYRRLHVIVGDANLSEVATFLKVGTTALVLSMIEDDWLDPRPAAGQAGAGAAPGVLRPDPARPIELADGSSITALEVQWELYDRARKFAEEHGLECIGGEDVGRRGAPPVGGRCSPRSRPTRRRSPARSTGSPSTACIDGYRERHGLRWDDARLAAMDLQYHDLRPEKSLAARVGLERIAADDEIDRGHHRAAARHPGLLPGPLPAALAREHRGRQLGLPGVRRRWRSAAPCAHDGTATWNRGARG